MSNWFWDPKYKDDKLVDADFIIDKYKLLTSASNSLVINVAPDIFGKQDPDDIQRLMLVAEKLGIARK